MTDWWFSSVKMTVLVTTDERGVITKAAPIVRKFEGQPLGNLERWMRQHGGFERAKLDETVTKEIHYP